MLLQFRKITRGAVATLIIALIGIATVLFLVPNGGLNLNMSPNLVDVGGHGITPAQLTRELDVTIRMQREEGANLTRQEAIDAGLHLQLLEGIVGRYAIQAYADKVGVSASDALVAERIRAIPNVRNPVTGEFDETAYAQFLGQLRYSRPEFERDIRGDMTTDLLLNSMVAGIRAPSSYGALAYAYDSETRVVTVVQAPASVVGAVPAPTEAQLQAFWEESQEQLRLPEFRALTLVYARPEDFVASVNIPEQRLREEFDARQAALTPPERRTYVRIAAQSEAQANDAAARLGRGESADAVARALGLQATRGQNQARSEVPDARVAAAVFAAPLRSVRVVQGSLSPWAVVRVDAISQPEAPNFAEIREELRQAFVAAEANDLLSAAIGEFEDARAAGTPIAEAARLHGLSVVTIPAVEAGGRSQDGQQIPALAGHEEILRTAFQTPEAEASDFIPVGPVDAIVSVDRIIPPSVRPLGDVRDELRQVWVARERARRLRELGAKIIADVRGGQAFAAAARANGFRVAAAAVSIDRARAAQVLPAQGLAAQIFGAAQGDVVSAIRADGEAVIAVRVESISRADPAAAAQIIEGNRVQFEQGLVGSFAESVRDEIVAQTEVRRHDPRIAAAFRPTNAEDGEAGQ